MREIKGKNFKECVSCEYIFDCKIRKNEVKSELCIYYRRRKVNAKTTAGRAASDKR